MRSLSQEYFDPFHCPLFQFPISRTFPKIVKKIRIIEEFNYEAFKFKLSKKICKIMVSIVLRNYFYVRKYFIGFIQRLLFTNIIP